MKENPTNTKDNPTNKTIWGVWSFPTCLFVGVSFINVCRIVQFAGFSCMKIRQIDLNYTRHPSNAFSLDLAKTSYSTSHYDFLFPICKKGFFAVNRFIKPVRCPPLYCGQVAISLSFWHCTASRVTGIFYISGCNRYSPLPEPCLCF